MPIDHRIAHPLSIPQLNEPVSLWVHDERDQHVSRVVAEQGIWEPYETHLVLEHLPPGGCFVDVGANIGYYSVLAARRVGPGGQVFAFEPEPDNFALLQRNLVENDCSGVCAVPAALSDRSGEGELFLNQDNFGDHQIYDRGEQRRRVAITLLNGSEYLSGRVTRIDVLKIDTQGAEARVMAGLLPLLRTLNPDLCVIIEFWPFGLRRAGSSAHQLLDMLLQLRLPLSIIDHVQHRLEPCEPAALREWIDMVDAHPDDEGFINLMLGG